MAIRLRGITWDDPRGWGPLQQVGRAFAGTHAGREVSVEWDIQPLEGFESAPLPELASRYDLINMDHPHVGEAVAAGCLLPIDGVAEDYVGPSRASYVLHSALWAVPVDAACQVSALHPGRIAEPPRAYAEIPRLAASGVRVASSLVGVHALMALLTLLAQAGHPLPAEREHSLPPRAALHEAATLLRALCSHMLPQSLRWNPLQLLDAMARGQVDYALFTFAYVGFTRRGVRFHPVPALAADRPTGGAVVGGTGLAVSAGSAQRGGGHRPRPLRRLHAGADRPVGPARRPARPSPRLAGARGDRSVLPRPAARHGNKCHPPPFCRLERPAEPRGKPGQSLARRRRAHRRRPGRRPAPALGRSDRARDGKLTMRVRPIDDLDRLRDAVTMIDAAFPLWSERTGRDFSYFARRFPSDGSLYLTLEDAAGTIGVALPTVEKDVVVLDTEFVAPSADSPSARAIVANAISAAAVAMNATRMAVPAGSQLAETYEEMGFAPTLFLQFDGARSRHWRQQAINRLDDLRLLEVRSHGQDVSQAVFRLEHVDRHLRMTSWTYDTSFTTDRKSLRPWSGETPSPTAGSGTS